MATLRAIRGDDFYATFTYTAPGPDCDTPGDPIDLTGYSVTLTMVVGTDTFSYTDMSGLTITPLLGKIELHVDDTVTATWGDRGTYSLVVMSPSGDVTTLITPSSLRVSDGG